MCLENKHLARILHLNNKVGVFGALNLKAMCGSIHLLSMATGVINMEEFNSFLPFVLEVFIDLFEGVFHNSPQPRLFLPLIPLSVGPQIFPPSLFQFTSL